MARGEVTFLLEALAGASVAASTTIARLPILLRGRDVLIVTPCKRRVR